MMACGLSSSRSLWETAVCEGGAPGIRAICSLTYRPIARMPESGWSSAFPGEFLEVLSIGSCGHTWTSNLMMQDPPNDAVAVTPGVSPPLVRAAAALAPTRRGGRACVITGAQRAVASLQPQPAAAAVLSSQPRRVPLAPLGLGLSIQTRPRPAADSSTTPVRVGGRQQAALLMRQQGRGPQATRPASSVLRGPENTAEKLTSNGAASTSAPLRLMTSTPQRGRATAHVQATAAQSGMCTTQTGAASAADNAGRQSGSHDQRQGRNAQTALRTSTIAPHQRHAQPAGLRRIRHYVPLSAGKYRETTLVA
ncbi:Hypothetical predicted protein [Cloeon dipterum]|uniref:Uncharacterized protein n=1 Tax=Cloeon dipterum TaxID=197152 RepID=A0A8S1DHE5_9INSE|nr:Hypothetical predicted protein [Cloeon dipterum]